MRFYGVVFHDFYVENFVLFGIFSKFYICRRWEIMMGFFINLMRRLFLCVGNCVKIIYVDDGVLWCDFSLG